MAQEQGITAQVVEHTRALVNKDLIDPYNHLNHAAWEVFLRGTRERAALVNNIAIDGVPATSAFLQHIRLEFKDQIKEGDDLDIVTEFGRDNGHVRFDQRVHRGENLVGTAKTTYGRGPVDGLTVMQDSSLRNSVIEVDDYFFSLKGRYMDQFAAATEYETERLRAFRERGLEEGILRERGLAIMAWSLDMNHGGEIQEGQEVNVRSHVDIRGPKIIFHQQVVHGGDVLNDAAILYVPVDMTKEKPRITQLPEDLANVLKGEAIYEVPNLREDRWLK